MSELDRYKSKRDFTRTPEPKPAFRSESNRNLHFVVQKHAASRLHYDFRLELDGVLKSWAVPKGPSFDRSEKKLAVLVEDHPLDYATFEGVIAHGNYGAGHVIVWDAGTYSPDEGGHLSFGNRKEAEERMRQELEAGKLSITLRGRKLKGSWTLVRTARSPTDWLLIKHKDKYADSGEDILKSERSVQSGLTLQDLKDGRLPDPALNATQVGEQARALGKGGTFPSKLKPMLARMVNDPFSHSDWLFEPKLDGFRALAFVRHGQVTVRSRNGIDLTERVPMIAAELQAQSEEELVLDGELVAINDQGLPDFGLLQQSMNMDRHAIKSPHSLATIVYYPFDLLHIAGIDLRATPLIERKKLLEQAIVPGDHVQHIQYVEADGKSFFEAALQLGLEGMVAKRRDSVYVPGGRSSSWLKVKAVKAQEFVIGGYTLGTGARSRTFGALLLGYYQGDKLLYAGRVGSGFDQSTLEDIQASLTALCTDASPFVQDPELDQIKAKWVRPELIAQTKFAQWTVDGRLRAPVFLGLRSDLDPKLVTRETEESIAIVHDAGAAPKLEASDAEITAILEQLSGEQDKIALQVAGHRVQLTNLNKELWPAADNQPSVTKRDMIRYYARISPALLPHLHDRPMTLTRYPNGIHGKSFYQKHLEYTLPEFVETVSLFSSHTEGDGGYIMVNNLPTLVWLAQLANIEFHPWLSRTIRESDALHASIDFVGSKATIESSVLNYPDFIVFDLDPYIYSGKESKGDEPELNRRAFSKVKEVAWSLREILDQLALSSFLKTSGKTGLHIYVPILRQYDYSITRKTCELIGRFVMEHRPNDVTMEWSVSKRTGKVFLDHNQNTRSKNMASIYSLRPLAGAPVSAPLRWDELKDVYPTDFNIETVPDRVEAIGDLWSDVLGAKHDLHRLLETAG